MQSESVVADEQSSSPGADGSTQRTAEPGPLTRRGFVTASLAIGSIAAGALFRPRTVGGATIRLTTGATATEHATRLGTRRTPARSGRTMWSEQFPVERGDVVIDSWVVLDVDARVRSLKITTTGRLEYAAGATLTLSTQGNVEVRGELVMQPATAAQRHRLHFDSVDEAEFVGGGMAVVRSDVGLWVSDDGRLLATGSDRTPWTRASGSLSAGSRKIVVDDAAGWQVGDQITISPTEPPSPDDGGFHQSSDGSHEYDDARITAIDRTGISLDRPLRHDHPMVTFSQWDGEKRRYGAEVLNLTRNVVVSGTTSGRAHVLFLHCDRPQHVSNVQFDQLGPRRALAADEQYRTAGVMGRYPFHMHHCGDGSRGSIIRNCLVTRSGNRAFVPHESHGVTLDGCVAHDVHGTAFWWDQPGRHNSTGENPETHDALWTQCVASKVWSSPGSENGYRLAGFNLSGGNHRSNRLIDSVAVGVTSDRVTMNTANNSGFHWTEHGQAVWIFTGCLAHNIGGNGILGWQNDEEIHPIVDFTAYHCGAHGIEHGAYSNLYAFDRVNLVGNRLSGIGCHAVTRRTNSVRRRWTDKGLPTPSLRFDNVVIDGQGITTDGIRGLSHRFAANDDGPTLFENIVVRGVTRAGLYEEAGNNAPIYVLKNFDVDRVEPVVFENGAPSGTLVTITNLNGDGTTRTLRP